jgi:pyruvate/2-oxoglutarate dehydrogenase complex dihydrolipoamide acyltransferase (E2) component
MGTPIIHYPQVAILGMGTVFKSPAVVAGQIQIRDLLYLSLSVDHRVIDGALAGRFLNALQRSAEGLTAEMLALG